MPQRVIFTPVRIIVLSLLIYGATGGSAMAGTQKGWHSFSNRQFGFSFQYPAGWRLLLNQPTRTVQVTGTGPGASSSLTGTVLPFPAQHSFQSTFIRFLGYQRATTHDSSYSRIHWTILRLGGKPALGGVLRLATEGGVAQSYGVYVTQSRGKAYEILTVSNRGARTLVSFPPVYRQVLASWRFR